MLVFRVLLNPVMYFKSWPVPQNIATSVLLLLIESLKKNFGFAKFVFRNMSCLKIHDLTIGYFLGIFYIWVTWCTL